MDTITSVMAQNELKTDWSLGMLKKVITSENEQANLQLKGVSEASINGIGSHIDVRG